MGKTRKEKPAEAAPASYTVVARRYRPQQFADIVGQEAVTRALVNALESNRVAHAYLFTGARGVGKTSTARILAKALSCVRGPTPTPCDQCDICRSIAAGEDVDVLEIDGASNRKIEEVRDIRSNVQYRPARARFKIYIIDEVHMLTKEAFNALLKTLEEPPPHVKFIFATTEVQKVPITILSRCQRFDFAGIGTGQIVERLREVVAGEKMQADDEALELVARRAGGSMRDAQSLLDQLLAFGGEGPAGRLTADAVHRLLGTAHEDRVAALAAAVLDHDPARTLALLGEAANEGLHLGELADQLIDYWRDLMVVHCAGAEGQSLSMPPRYREALARQAKGLPLDTILAGLDVLAAAKARMRGSNHPRVLLEAALVRVARLPDLVALADLVRMVTDGRAGEARPAAGPARQPPRAPEPARPTAGRPPLPPEAEKKSLAGGADGAAPPAPAAFTEQSLPQVWPEVLRQVGPMLAGNLEKAEGLAIPGPNTLVLRFAPRYNLQRDYCQEPRSLARVEDALRKVTGQAWGVRVESLSNPTAAASPPADDADPSPSRYRRQRTEAMQEPLVKRAFEVLGAQIVRVDDGFGSAPRPADRSESADAEES